MSKAKKAAICLVSLIAIKLKGLAAPGEALKNFHLLDFRISISEVYTISSGHSSFGPQKLV